MNLSKSLILTSALFAVTAIGSASPITTVFNVTGQFTDGSVLGGSFDISNGQITSAAMTISGVTGTFTLDHNGGGFYSGHGYWEDVDLSDNGNTLQLGLVLKSGATTLTGYTGGALCSFSGNCGDVVSGYTPASMGHQVEMCDDPGLASGNAATAAPEPGATALLGAGLSMMGFLVRRKRAAQN